MIKKWLLFAVLFSQTLCARGYLCAVGGGTENYHAWSDEPYRWMVNKSEYGPALILHYSDGSVWLENYFKSFGAVSAASLVIASQSAANDSAVYRKIKETRLLFLRGGDQYQYFRLWRNTLAEQAICEVFAQGGVVGGTSAGLAVLGELDYIAARGSATSAEALLDPVNADITLADDFLPLATDVLFDSHFTRRGRLGRLLAFVANGIQTRPLLLGIGVDEHTAVCIDPEHNALISGAGAAFIVLQPPGGRARCESQWPLTLTHWTLHSLTHGFRINLRDHTITPPATARAAAAVPLVDNLPAAAVRLAAGASVTTDALRWLTTPLPSKPVLVIYKKGYRSVASFQLDLGFSNLTALEIEPLTFSDHPQLGAAIREHDQILVAGFNATEMALLFAPATTTCAAWHEQSSRSQVKILITDCNAAPLGAVWINNLQTGSYALQDGLLQLTAGAELLPGPTFMPDAFKSDDYIENRVGGFFWQFIHSQGRLAVLSDVNNGWLFANAKLSSTTPMPVVVVDGQAVTFIDSSNYRYKSYRAPRQTAAFVNAILHCLPASAATFDCVNRKIVTPAQVKLGSSRQPEKHRIDYFPNPVKDFLQIKAPGRDKIDSISLCDILGRQVTRLPAKRTGEYWRVDLSSVHLCSGHYFFTVQGEGTLRSGSLTVMK